MGLTDRSAAASTADSARVGHLRALTHAVDVAAVRSLAPSHPPGESARERVRAHRARQSISSFHHAETLPLTAPAPRAFALHEIAARAWFYLSPFPEERGLAARRYREHSALAEADHLLQIIGELAVERSHARAISAVIVLDRVKTIPNETNARAVAVLLARLRSSMRMP